MEERIELLKIGLLVEILKEVTGGNLNVVQAGLLEDAEQINRDLDLMING